jgi:uncharacterized protein YheU (UPF0270 family)
MSTDASTAAREDTVDETTDYERMLDTLDTAIAEARRKIESGRVYDPENEKVRIKWIRALAYSVNVRRQVTADRDLEDLGRRIEQLEREQGVGK